MNTQTIFRSTHVRNYTVFSNDLIANPDLALDQGLITQEEFNATLEDFFWEALHI